MAAHMHFMEEGGTLPGECTEEDMKMQAIEAALRYKNKFGATPLRGLARMASLMSNTIIPKTLVEQVTNKFCEHMFTICDMVQKAHTVSKEAHASLQLIQIARDLFSLGLTIHVACPVEELFLVQYERLFDIMADAIDRGLECESSDAASDASSDVLGAWHALMDDLGDASTTVNKQDWSYDHDSHEWRPDTPLDSDASDAESLAEEEAFLRSQNTSASVNEQEWCYGSRPFRATAAAEADACDHTSYDGCVFWKRHHKKVRKSHST